MHPSLARWDSPAPSPLDIPSKDPKADLPKKPRHRHAPYQLAALNELYEKTEHPSLEQRTALAERLHMYVPTVPLSLRCPTASHPARPTSSLQGDKDGQLVVPK